MLYRSAVIEGDFRYRLDRGVRGKSLGFIMVNPSTADATKDDPTIRKILGFADRLNFKHVIVGNKFAYRTPYIDELRRTHDPVGPENDRHLEEIIRDSDMVVVAWGSLTKLPEPLRRRWRDVVRLAQKLDVRLHCIGTTIEGHPRHPLMTPYNTPVTRWRCPRPPR